MFFVLSKILGFLTQVSSVAIAAGLLGAVLSFSRFARAGRGLMVGGLVALAIAGFSPLGYLLLLPLEQRFPAWREGGTPPTGIVVLGGAIDQNGTLQRDAVALNDAAERMTAAVTLARRYPSARLLFSGGSAALMQDDGAEADAAIRLFGELGVAPQRIETDGDARNTVENARHARALANPKPGERWLLVTSAYHMPRSIGVFRQAGFAVEAYPVDWRTHGQGDVWRPFPMLGNGLRLTDIATHEWAGLLMYRLAGYTSALFPAPEPKRD